MSRENEVLTELQLPPSGAAVVTTVREDGAAIVAMAAARSEPSLHPVSARVESPAMQDARSLADIVIFYPSRWFSILKTHELSHCINVLGY